MEKFQFPKLTPRMQVLKMLELPYQDNRQIIYFIVFLFFLNKSKKNYSVKDTLNVFPQSSKSTNFLPYLQERDSIGRLISV